MAASAHGAVPADAVQQAAAATASTDDNPAIVVTTIDGNGEVAAASDPSQGELWALWSERREKKKAAQRAAARSGKKLDSKTASLSMGSLDRIKEIRRMNSKTDSQGSRIRGPYDSNDGHSIASSGRSRMSGSSVRSLDRGVFQLSTNAPPEMTAAEVATPVTQWEEAAQEERRCWSQSSPEGGAAALSDAAPSQTRQEDTL